MGLGVLLSLAVSKWQTRPFFPGTPQTARPVAKFQRDSFEAAVLRCAHSVVRVWRVARPHSEISERLGNLQAGSFQKAPTRPLHMGAVYGRLPTC